MEGERRKRKLERDEEENEEQKMEKFFALIKSTKDARDQLFNKDSNKVDEEDQKKGKGMIWTPMFQPEDFIDCGDQFGKSANVSTATQVGPSEEKGKGKEVMQIEKEHLQQEAITPAAVAPTPQNHEPEQKEKARDHPLDLNLSLW